MTRFLFRLRSARSKITLLALTCLLAGGMSSLRYLGSLTAHADAPGSASEVLPSGAAVAPAPSPRLPGALSAAPVMPQVVVTTPADAGGLNVVAILATIGVVLGGVALLLAGLAVILHALAKATHSSVLETAAVDVDHVRDTVVDVLEELGITPPGAATSAPGPAPATVTIVNHATPAEVAAAATPPKVPQAGRARVVMLLLLAIAGSIGVGSLAGCTQTSRQDTIHAALVTADAGRDGLLAYDQVHEQAIVAAATSAADGQAKLAAYRAARGKVVAGLEGAYRALVVAALSNDDLSLSNAQAIVSQLIAAIQSLITTAGGK